MAWIEFHDDVWEHHKTERFADALGLPLVYAVGHLTSLWTFVLRNAWRDANLEPWGDRGIERGARWVGEPGKFVTAARECGILDGSVVHGWLERAGKLVQDRLYNEERKKNAVIRRKTDATVPNLTQPNPTVPNQQDPMVGFEAFWTLYPRKTAKQAAAKAWKKLQAEEVLQVRIKAAVASHALSDQWTKDGGQFIPHAATWLNQKRWEDELKAGSSRGVGAAVPVAGKYQHLEAR